MAKKKKSDGPVNGQLRVWHIPQVPGKPFLVNVANVLEGKLVLNVLADYDTFQFENNIKPDYCNTGGLSVFDVHDDHDGPDGSWVGWYSAEGEDIGFYSLEDIRAEMTHAETIDEALHRR